MMEKMMGTVVEEITLINDRDVARVEAGVRSDVRQVTVEAIVDTGAVTLAITEDIRERLGLEIVKRQEMQMANGTVAECGVTTVVDIHWKDRNCCCGAVVIPGANYVLLGALPLEFMDLVVETRSQRLVGAHGDEVKLLML
jgi:clan AA aspartic protease